MEFSELDALREQVRRTLTVLLNSVQVDADGNFHFRHDSTLISVRLVESDNWTVIDLHSVTDWGWPMTGVLFKYVAEWGQNHHLGALSVSPDEDDPTMNVNYEWAFFGMNFDAGVFEQALTAFALIADQTDDEVQAYLGDGGSATISSCAFN